MNDTTTTVEDFGKPDHLNADGSTAITVSSDRRRAAIVILSILVVAGLFGASEFSEAREARATAVAVAEAEARREARHAEEEAEAEAEYAAQAPVRACDELAEEATFSEDGIPRDAQIAHDRWNSEGCGDLDGAAPLGEYPSPAYWTDRRSEEREEREAREAEQAAREANGPTTSPSCPSGSVGVLYRVERSGSATGGAASMTLENFTGGVDQGDYSLPFAATGCVTPGSFLYLSAQNLRSGAITCTIVVDGQTVSRGTAAGQYQIASCSD